MTKLEGRVQKAYDRWKKRNTKTEKKKERRTSLTNIQRNKFQMRKTIQRNMKTIKRKNLILKLWRKESKI